MPPYSWAEEHSLFSRWSKYWMLSMKFQIDYLVFIRSMRKGNFKLLTKLWYLWIKFSISTITLDGYPYTFKICWFYPSHALNSIKNLKEDILWFRVVSFDESITTNLTTRRLSISKGQSISWIEQAMSYRAGGRSQGPNCRIFKISREQNTQSYQPKWPP